MQGSNEYFFNFFLKFPNIYCFIGFLNIEYNVEKGVRPLFPCLKNIDGVIKIDYHKTYYRKKYSNINIMA